MNPRQGNGLDLKVWFGGTLTFVAEVINWSVGSQLSNKRYRTMMYNFSKYDCAKVLIYTILDKDKVKKFESKRIITLEIGYQVLPKAFYEFFKHKGQAIKRKTDSKQTTEDVKEKIQSLVTLINALNEIKRNGNLGE